MRYKVVFGKLNGLAHDGSQSENPDKETVLIGDREHHFQRCENMFVLKKQDNLVQSKNNLNKMVNTEPDDFAENDQKETFQYQIPRVRASFTLKVSPDSATADLAEPISESIKESKNSTTQTLSTLASDETPLLDYGLHLPDNDPVSPVKHFQPRVPAQPILANKPPKSIVANKSTHTIPNDDKDFEIPLEESLKAVEDFIKREKELSKWNVGEDVLAKWKGNGLYYKAKIIDIFPSGIVMVSFDSYEIKEEIDYKDLCKFFKKTSEFKKKGQPHQERLKDETECKKKICAKIKIEAKKQKKRIKVPFKTSDMLRRKLLLKKFCNSPLIKSKRSQRNIKDNKK